MVLPLGAVSLLPAEQLVNWPRATAWGLFYYVNLLDFSGLTAASKTTRVTDKVSLGKIKIIS